jgi:predicted flap endonuclease-1-like 5' DNA nuclease
MSAMSADLTAYLPLIAIALVALVVLVWIISRSTRRARVTDEDGAPGIFRDVLEEGAAPAARNQALIDAPRGVEIIEGDLSAMANAQVTGASPLGADDEAGPIPAPAPTPAAAGQADDLTRIKGLGPKLAALLGEFGVTTYAQIAAWSPEEVERIDAKLGRFAGRITRDQWVEQARFLAAGDEPGFTARFGNNG